MKTDHLLCRNQDLNSMYHKASVLKSDPLKKMDPFACLETQLCFVDAIHSSSKTHLNPHCLNKLSDIYTTYEENTLDQPSRTLNSHYRNKYDLALNVQLTIYSTKNMYINAPVE